MWSYLQNEAKAFHVALSFLTRWGKATIVDNAIIAKSIRWYGPVGFILGIMLVASLYFFQKLGYTHSWTLALIYIALEMWFTRGLHYDAIADLGDALGSGSKGEKFWQILYDSRLGAFGAMTLSICLIASLVAVQKHITNQNFFPLLLAPAYARLACVIFACCTNARNEQSLGGAVCAGKSTSICIFSSLIACILCLLQGFTISLIILMLSAWYLLFLRRKALQEGGCNGDFLGSVIVGTQTLYLLLS